MSEVRQQLKEMMQLESNKHCADCGSYPATWASANLGVFLCVHCAGIHRSLGVHISLIKSCTLDDWNQRLFLRFKQNGGNETVNAKYEAKLQSADKISERFHVDPSLKIDVIKFIRNKYEKKMWYKDVDKKRNKSSKRKVHKSKRKSAPAQDIKIASMRAQSQSYSLTPTPEMNSKLRRFPRKDSFLSDDDLDEFHKEFHDPNHPKQQKQPNAVPDILDLIKENHVVEQSINHNNNNHNHNNRKYEMKQNNSAKNILSKYYNNAPNMVNMNVSVNVNMNMNGANGYPYQNQVSYNNNYNGMNMVNNRNSAPNVMTHYQYQQPQQRRLSPLPMNYTTNYYGNNAMVNPMMNQMNGNNNNSFRKLTW